MRFLCLILLAGCRGDANFARPGNRLKLSRIKAPEINTLYNVPVLECGGKIMVEKTDHSGLWPSLYDPFRAMGTRLADWLNPATEASSGEEAYDIAMELPGVGEDDIELSVDDGVVTIRGEKKTSSEKKGDTWYFSERQYGAFRRSFRLPADADGSKASASMKDGVLHVKVPRLSPEAVDTEKKIKITRG
jgi:HSP20 family protein